MKITDLIWNNTITRFISKHWIAIVILLTIPSYLYGRSIMISQISEWRAILSNFTVNFLLFLGLFGWLIDDMTKKMTKWKGWLIWGLATGMLFLLLKLAGFDRMFG
jgi:phosphoglycerol transferase MdoB-like AlkP superfamily enzyme